MLRLRKIFFYFFVLIYCLACPTAILYALGYIWKPGAEHGITRAGLIYLSTTPPGASVWVENKRFAEKTPTMIRGLLPGRYPLTLYLKGHKLWKRAVTVEAEKAVTLDKVLLLPEHWQKRKVFEGEFNSLVPLRSPRYLILARGPWMRELFLCDLKEETLLSKDTRIYDFFGKKVYMVYEEADFDSRVFPRGKYIFFGQQGDGDQWDARTERLLVWREDKIGVRDLSGGRKSRTEWLVPGARHIDQAFWVHEASHVLYRDGDKVNLLELDETAPRIQECVQVLKGSSIAYSEKTGTIYYLEKGTGFFCAATLVEKREF